VKAAECRIVVSAILILKNPAWLEKMKADVLKKCCLTSDN